MNPTPSPPNCILVDQKSAQVTKVQQPNSGRVEWGRMNQPIHWFLVGCLNPWLQGTNVWVGSNVSVRPHPATDLGKPTHTLVPRWMYKPLPPTYQCTCSFTPALQPCLQGTNVRLFPPTCRVGNGAKGAYITRK